MPSEPPGSDFKDKVRLNAYPVRELGDTVWVYMGPGTPPELPQMEWATVPASHRRVAMWMVECNWLQVLEGNVDTAHVSFLHSATDGIPGVREEGLEHLGTSDLAVIAMRRVLERRAQDLQKGVRPRSAHLANQFGARPLDVVCPEASLGEVLARYATEVRMTAVNP